MCDIKIIINYEHSSTDGSKCSFGIVYSMWSVMKNLVEINENGLMSLSISKIIINGLLLLPIKKNKTNLMTLFVGGIQQFVCILFRFEWF